MSKQPPIIRVEAAPEILTSGVVIGVSGGVDSVVLLDLMARLGKRVEGSRIVVAHVNYRLRRTSDGDERFVEQLAAKHQVEYFLKRCRKRSANENLQEWARDIRYAYFTKIAEKTGCGYVAVAHHVDDQAETVLWHLLRGAGLNGLSGMARERPLTPELTLVRPLLFTERSEISAYAEACRLSFRNDHTNCSSKYTRGRIRTELLPICESIMPGASRHIAELAARVATDEEHLIGRARVTLDAITVRNSGSSFYWNRREFLKNPVAIQVRILQLAYVTVSGSLRRLGSDHIEKMSKIASGEGEKYCLPGGLLFRREGPLCGISKGPLHSSRHRGNVQGTHNIMQGKDILVI